MTDAGFGPRLTAVRRQQGLTQQAVADRAGVHVTNIRRYEAGKAAPTVHILRSLAIALHVSADALLFDPAERGPEDDLALRLEAISRLDPDEKAAILALIESMLLRHEARRLTPPCRHPVTSPRASILMTVCSTTDRRQPTRLNGTGGEQYEARQEPTGNGIR